MSKALVEKINFALSKEPNLLVPRQDTFKHQGYPESYFDALGITRSDLKRMERIGFALRGYTKNAWFPGDIMPNGRPAPGEWSVLDIKGRVAYKDIRGYTRYMEAFNETKIPSQVWRGRGHEVRWVLVAPVAHGG